MTFNSNDNIYAAYKQESIKKKHKWAKEFMRHHTKKEVKTKEVNLSTESKLSRKKLKEKR